MNWKEFYTKVFLKELDKSTNDATIKEHLPLWWKNTRTKDKGGLRLTDQGLEVIKTIELKTYEVPFPKEFVLTAQSVIFLDHFITCPYYLTNHNVILLNDRI